MSAYVIVDIEVTDSVEYEQYKALAPPIVASFGGRYLARGGQADVLEGEWSPNRLVIMEFDTAERAKEWLESDEYAAARAIRNRASNSNMVVVDGVA